MIILNETIRTDLIVFIAFFADLGTIAIAYDNAPYARAPVEWQLQKIWIVSTILGLLLAGGTWILRATLFLDNGGIIQNWGSVQEILFLEVALTEVSVGGLWEVSRDGLINTIAIELVDLCDSRRWIMAIVATRRGHPWNRHPCQHLCIIWMDFWSGSTQWVSIYPRAAKADFDVLMAT
jgi:hypothetical protein